MERFVSHFKLCALSRPSRPQSKRWRPFVQVHFTTFHMSKGLQRRIVIVICFSRLYFKFFAKGRDPNVCPETLYVGM